MPGPEPRWKAEAEEAILRLPGVVGARIRLEGGSIGAVFVQTDGSREPRRFVRDVETILATQAGVALDYRKVSVAATPPGGAPVEAGRLRSEGRAAFENVHVRTSGLETEAQVELSLGEARVLGTATGPATREGTLYLVAEASLRAAALLLDEPVGFALAGLERVRLGGQEALVVLVRVVEGRGERTLSGSSPCSQDDLRSAAYATLDAINRVFGRLKLREPVEYVVRSPSLLHTSHEVSNPR